MHKRFKMAAATAEGGIILSVEKPAKLLKWKVKQHARVTQGSLIAIFQEEGSSKEIKIRCHSVGTVVKLLAREGEIYNPG